LKIALIHKKYTTHGGTERYLVGLSNFLAGKNHEVHVFTGSWDAKVADPRIIFHAVPCWGKHVGIAKFIFANNVKREINKYHFDIVQTFSRIGFGDVIRIGGGCHQVYISNELNSYHNRFKKIIKLIREKISLNSYLTRFYEAKDFQTGHYKKLIAVSSMVKDEIIENYGVPAEEIIVNHNGVDLKKFAPENRDLYRKDIRLKYGLNEHDIVLLFLGTGFERKGVEYILKSLARIKVSNVKLLVVGKGNISKYAGIVHRLRLSSRVIFTGPSAKVEAFYAAGDIFVFPSIYDPCANVSLEAMASGLPLITTKTNGASGIVDHGENGFILERADDVETLVKYIEILLDKDKRTEMSQKARTKMLDYTIDKNFQRLLEIYRDI
jgi:UDP-glucose:(heptosyl)LPS alpha-1,3-glucosyltransferase